MPQLLLVKWIFKGILQVVGFQSVGRRRKPITGLKSKNPTHCHIPENVSISHIPVFCVSEPFAPQGSSKQQQAAAAVTSVTAAVLLRSAKQGWSKQESLVWPSWTSNLWPFSFRAFSEPAVGRHAAEADWQLKTFCGQKQLVVCLWPFSHLVAFSPQSELRPMTQHTNRTQTPLKWPELGSL